MKSLVKRIYKTSLFLVYRTRRRGIRTRNSLTFRLRHLLPVSTKLKFTPVNVALYFLSDVPRIRLTGPRNREGAGIVEVFIYRQWGRICDDYWGTDDAKVVCKELGYPGVDRATCCGSYFGVGYGPPQISHVACNGNEKSLFHCRHVGRTGASCGRRDSAGVICKLNQPNGKEAV